MLHSVPRLAPVEEVLEIHVGIADYKVTGKPHRLITVGLGSCVGVSLYDPGTGIGGLLHVMLPEAQQTDGTPKPAKYADTGIPVLVEALRREGAALRRLEAKLAGGAQMFAGADEKFLFNIGSRNAEVARRVLKSLGIRIVAEDVGGTSGRTMILDTATGQVIIRMLGAKVKVI